MINIINTINGNDNIHANDDGITIDFDFFKSDKNTILHGDGPVNNKKKKSTATKKISMDDIPEGELVNPIVGSAVTDVDYAKSYTETNNLIKGAIMQADELCSEIKGDIDSIRSSKTLKNKYTYLTNLSTTAGGLISTKIAAIKELNNSITQSHNLELNRMKTLKLNESAENDDMKMMDMYSAFINTPLGTYTPSAPNIQDITLGTNNANPSVSAVEMTAPTQTNANLSPEQNRMRMENNPNIITVVKYDQSTGQRCFDVIDSTTGASIPNYPRPDNFLLEDTNIDIHSNIARNRNVNMVWPLVLCGNNNFVNEY